MFVLINKRVEGKKQEKLYQILHPLQTALQQALEMRACFIDPLIFFSERQKKQIKLLCPGDV